MKQDTCTCEKPLLQERSEQKGSSESWCGRCKRPLSLRPGAFRVAFDLPDLAPPDLSGV
jgi:hypothetical protein